MKSKKRTIAFILSLCMTFSMLGHTIMAGEIGHLVISQIYGGGGNNGAPYLNDFIELYNPTEQDISLNGYSVQYASATGKFESNITLLQGTIKAKSYYLIKEASGNANGVELPTADAEGNIPLSGTKGKVALVKKIEAISGKTDPAVVDFVGFGAANEYETAAAKAPSNTTSIIRVNNQDTDDNSNDFKTTTPNPRNSQTSGAGETEEQEEGFTIKHTPITTATRGSDLYIGFATTARTTGSVLVITTEASIKHYDTGEGTDFHVKIPKEDINNCSEIQYAIEMTDGTYARRMPKEGTYKVSIKEGSEAETPSQGTKSIKAAKALGTGQTVTIEGIVLNDYVNKSLGCYIQDATGGILLFDSGTWITRLKAGDKVRVTGKTAEYNKKFELTELKDGQIINQGEQVTPKSIAISDVKEAYEGQWVVLKGVKIDKLSSDTYNNSNFTLSKDEKTIKAKLDSRRGVEYESVAEKVKAGDLVNITGIVEDYNGTYSLQIIRLEDIELDDSPDNEKPMITHTDVKTGTIFENINITCEVSDNKKVDKVWLYYKAKSAESYNQVEMVLDTENKVYTGVIKKEEIKAEGMLYYIVATDGTNQAIYPEDTEKQVEIAISDKDEAKPEVVKCSPSDKQVVVNNTKPAVTVQYKDNNGIDVTKIQLFVDETTVTEKSEITAEKITYKPEEAMSYGVHKAKIVLVDMAGNKEEKEWQFTISDQKYSLYFGQLHAHTAENSDGQGTLEEAYDYAKNTAKLDFFALTDHSNAYDTANASDTAGTYNLRAYNKDNVKWQKGLNEAAKATDENFVGIQGFEMTWSGGPGHINTFNTEGFVSRNNKELNNKTNDAGLKAYYALLKETPESISQFNHPGKTFGNFNNYAYYDPIVDERISLIEVGNGEGAIGSGGYFPSYEEYTKALDKGWHLAPTNNQDNHKKGWGTSNTARDVVLTIDFTREGIYDALRERRVYATEDSDLEIFYTLNDEVLGTIIDEVPEKACIKADINDPTDEIASISIITNGGRIVYSENVDSAVVNFEYNMDTPAAGYYYLRIVEKDADIAVTAPIWLGEAPSVGITDADINTSMPVTNEALTITTNLFNNEKSAAVVKNITYSIEGEGVIESNALNKEIASQGTLVHQQTYTPLSAGTKVLQISVDIETLGSVKTYTLEKEIKVREDSKLVYVGVDGSHYNEYVNGNYKDCMKNLTTLAADYDVRIVQLNTSEALMSALTDPKYKMMIFAPPGRKDSREAVYTGEELTAIAHFAKAGNGVIVTGLSDYNDKSSTLEGLDKDMAGQQNQILKAIGASLRIADDGALDDANNAGQNYRLRFKEYNWNHPLNKGVVAEQEYSQYSGSTIYAVDENGEPTESLNSQIQPIVSSWITTRSEDQDNDGYGLENTSIQIPKYDNKYLIAASETITYEEGISTQVIVAGAVFMSDFEVQAEQENSTSLNYSNYNICQNILSRLNVTTVTPIVEAKKAAIGTEMVLQGTVTTNVYNGSDQNKGFFDCIYIQDKTGGINVFPVAEGVEEGQVVRITGRLEEYQGELELKVTKLQVISEETNLVIPVELTTLESMQAENTGMLIRTKGRVKEITKDAEGVVSQLIIDDGSGEALVLLQKG